jgi:hypothetical protein
MINVYAVLLILGIVFISVNLGTLATFAWAIFLLVMYEGEKDGMAKATPICKITCEPKEEVK